ncbi:hypothetical protein JZ785_09435 [Alicyclobacillus curvatus]|nr:hypothetical protein JZ785_09435 [Alicyclobacillus curvatus]
MTSRLPELEARIANMGNQMFHHEVYHFVKHSIDALRRLETTIQNESRAGQDYEMHTVHKTIDRSISELVTVLEKTVEDWEHRLDKSKPNFQDGVE